MAPWLLFVNVTKVVGVAGMLTVAANSIVFHRFKKKNFSPLEGLIDEEQEILASFPVDKDVEDGGFFFALATAPAHVEDKLHDAWIEFAEQTIPEDQDRKQSQLSEHSKGEESSEEISGSVASGNNETTLLNQSSLLVRVGSEAKLSGDCVVSTEEVSRLYLPQGEGGNPDTLSEWELLTSAQGKEIYESSNAGKGRNVGKNQQLEIEGLGIESEDDITGKVQLKERKDDESDLLIREIDTRASLNTGSLVGESISSYQEDQHSPVMVESKHTIEESKLQVNLPKKGHKLVKLAMEAMIRGIESFVEEEEEKLNVAAWHNVTRPEERLRFWSDPDVELRLAKETNITVFRMGIDWGRIMPIEPLDEVENSINWDALEHYRWIIGRVHAHGMRVMLTLFHHSLPSWAAKYGGWRERKTVKYFLQFTRLVTEKFADLIDFWITFNEPHVFAMLTYCAGAWPGGCPDLLETATAIMPKGVFTVVMQNMAEAHLEAYDIIHDNSKKLSKKAKVGISHHISFMRPYGLFDMPAVILSNWKTRFAFVDDICNKLDYLGINYYGQEIVSAPGLRLVEDEEYSESGRGVYPDGLYRMLLDFHDRYKEFKFSYIITENGVSDATDYIRRPYIIEHLLAVRAAMHKGVPVQGYCFWTTSDNWEWADGYGPKFGLAAVDRKNNLARMPRPSYYLYAEIARTGKVSKQQREKAWNELQSAALDGKKRPFYRSVDGTGRMYAGGLDVPIERPFVHKDWRFGHYHPEGLQDPVSSILRFLLSNIKAWFPSGEKVVSKDKRKAQPQLVCA